MTFELVIFSVVALIVISILTIVVFLVGLPFHLSLGAAIAIAGYIFAVILPGGANLWIAVVAEDRVVRMTSGVRGVAMICGWTSIIYVFAPRNAYSEALPWLIASCAIMFVWSIWREDQHRKQKLQSKGLLNTK